MLELSALLASLGLFFAGSAALIWAVVAVSDLRLFRAKGDLVDNT